MYIFVVHVIYGFLYSFYKIIFLYADCNYMLYVLYIGCHRTHMSQESSYTCMYSACIFIYNFIYSTDHLGCTS